MDSSTTEFWDIDGVSLNTYCWNIKSFGGSRMSVPSLRGDNRRYPNRTGQAFRPKIADSKVISLAMWVTGADTSTGLPSTNDQIAQWNDNWNYLRRLLWTPDREVSLTRRWLLNAAAPQMQVATANAQLAGQMEPNMTGRSRADFVVDLLLADPFFYGDEISVAVPANATVDVFNPGDSKSSNMPLSITFTGNLSTPTLTNQTNGVWMKIGTVIASGTNVSTDVATFNARRSTDLSNMGTSISQGGARQWMVLEPGLNRLKLTATGAGAATIKFRPAYV